MKSIPFASDENMDLRWFKTEQHDRDFEAWMEKVVFPQYFNKMVFDAGETLYEFDLNRSLLVQAVHYGVPTAGFSESQLSTAIQEACKQLGLPDDSWWFHVNVHDGIARVVEKFGRYNYSYPLTPIYILLEHHCAKQGGTTYAGLVSPHRSWMLLFDSGTSISVHGKPEFVEAISRRVRGT